MSSTAERQKKDSALSDSVSTSKDVNAAPLIKSDENMPPPPAKETDEEKHLAADLATLKLSDEKVASEKGKDTPVNTASDEEFFSDEETEQHPVEVDENTDTDTKLTAETPHNAEDVSGASIKEREGAVTFKGDEEHESYPIKAKENTNPKLTPETPNNAEDVSSASVKVEDKTTTSKGDEELASHPIETNENTNSNLTYEAASKPEDASTASTQTNGKATASEGNNTINIPEDETATPRLAAYIKLHNDMMTSKSALASSPTEQYHLYHHAMHVARTLLASNAKHSDLPLVMHAHACMVLGCSDVNDCVERMQEALALVRQAVKEELLGEKEGHEMLRTCEVVMQIWGQEYEYGEGEYDGDEADDEGEDEDEDEGG